MALSTIGSAKTHLGIAAGDTSEDAQITQWLFQADTIIKNYLRQPFIDVLQVYTLSGLDGNNAPLYVLPYRPVQAAALTCTLTLNSATITVPSTTGMIVGMPVVGANNLAVVPAGTTIQSIDTTNSQVTLTNPVTSAGSVLLYFGIDAYLDMGAFYGTGNGTNSAPFSATTQLIPGTDYALRPDSYPSPWTSGNLPGWSTSKGGIVARLNGVWGTGIERTRGLITQGIGPAKGCLKFVITAGYGGLIGTDLEFVCNMLVARIRQSAQWGASLSGEAYRGFSASHGDGAKGGLLTSEMKNLLSPYRSLIMSTLY